MSPRHERKKSKKVIPQRRAECTHRFSSEWGGLRTATRISYALSRKLEKKGKHLSRCAEEKAES